MIVYFTDRQLNILAAASTSHASRFVIVDDKKTEDSETGIGTFELEVAFDDDSRLELTEMMSAGNCILRADGSEEQSTASGSHDFFTITETEIDVKNKTIYAYAEDAGLDLINDLAPAVSYSAETGIETYITDFTAASGFEIRINEIPNAKQKLSWTSESTVSERLQSIAESFDCDLSFAFEIQRLAVTAKYIDITESTGSETDLILYMNRDVSNITVKESINNLATALRATGKDGLTLSGYTYDDGDFYVNGDTLFSREALNNWRRKSWSADASGDVYRTYSCEAASKLRLCEMAIEELKKLREPEVNYEVEIRSLESSVRIRDRISVVDDKGELYLSAKVLQLETSVTAGAKKATLGDYIMRESGISDTVHQLADKFSELSKDRYIWIAYADDETGEGISTEKTTTTGEDRAYVGTAYSKGTETVDTTNPDAFTWVMAGAESAKTLSVATAAQGQADTAQDIADKITEIVSGTETETGLAGNLENLTRKLYGDGGDIDTITGATSELSDATAALKLVQESLSQSVDEVASQVESYKGYISIDNIEPSITVGAGSDTKLKLARDKVSFMTEGNEAASLSNDKLKATSSEVTNLYMKSVDSSGNTVGTLGWLARSNGHLSLKVME